MQCLMNRLSGAHRKSNALALAVLAVVVEVETKRGELVRGETSRTSSSGARSICGSVRICGLHVRATQTGSVCVPTVLVGPATEGPAAVTPIVFTAAVFEAEAALGHAHGTSEAQRSDVPDWASV